ncbi:MAG: ATP-binding protein [Pseudanabaenaceae cyanobacterium]
MPPAPRPANELQRLAALRRYDILDTEFEKNFNDLAEIAAYICGTPIALISLVDEDRQWFKARVGIDVSETPRDLAFCAYALLNQQELLIVPDATQDPRFADNPLVQNDPQIRFYAGAPINTPDGYCLGTICTLDRQPKQLTPQQEKALSILANQVISQLELRLSLKKLTQANEELAKLNRSKDKFFATLAHDLRLPFNGIIGLAEVIANEPESLTLEELREYGGYIYESSLEAFKILNNLLEWSIYQSGGLSYKPTYFSLNATVKKVIGLLGSLAEKKKIHLQLDMPENVQVCADERMIYSVLQNLIANALKFTPAGGTVTVKAYVQDSSIYVHVIDEGVGIDPEILSKLLQGEQGHSTEGTGWEAGSGLGLTLCRQFVEKNGGKLLAQSQIGAGSEFIVILPSYP